jgi:hypothetical protein
MTTTTPRPPDWVHPDLRTERRLQIVPAERSLPREKWRS